MINNSPALTLPLNGMALDFVKICAAVFMVVDHINSMMMGSQSLTMLLIGRGAYPLFALACAIAVLRKDPVSNRSAAWSYAISLLILAIISEPISQLTRDIAVLNILFTLAGGVLLAGYVLRAKLWQRQIIFTAALVLSPLVYVSEFGMAGLCLPAALALAIAGKREGWGWSLLFLLLLNTGGFFSFLDIGFTGAAFYALLTSFGAITALVTCSLIARELPQTGRLLPRYALHVFYPAHLLILWSLAHATGSL